MTSFEPLGSVTPSLPLLSHARAHALPPVSLSRARALTQTHTCTYVSSLPSTRTPRNGCTFRCDDGFAKYRPFGASSDLCVKCPTASSPPGLIGCRQTDGSIFINDKLKELYAGDPFQSMCGLAGCPGCSIVEGQTGCGDGGTCDGAASPSTGEVIAVCNCGTDWQRDALGICTQCVAGKYKRRTTKAMRLSVKSNPPSTYCAPCLVGSFCPGGAALPDIQPCPESTYGNTSMIATAECTGVCEAGYDGTPTGSTSSTCGGACRKGYWCEEGELPQECGGVNVYCPVGDNSVCIESANCDQWCSVYNSCGETEAYKGVGATDCRGNAGAVAPWPVKANHYSTPAYGNAERRTGQKLCLDGSRCAGGVITMCPGGVYCKRGVVKSCDSVAPIKYCPKTSSAPLIAAPGYYTVPLGFQADQTTPLAREGQLPCEAGYACSEGTRTECGALDKFSGTVRTACSLVQKGFYSIPDKAARAGTREGELICERGHYCVGGNKFECPAGTFGEKTGLWNETCSGYCTAGSICPKGSTR